ncbi:diguanylate cyclase [Colwellia sp. MB02u-6]|uniref:diguanylate cyclase n=1 Tax=Colwellia sp. MB02u-6 TaxID=2759824 RepID=UPI0015F3B759|nr:diguanylate cyclase [Colwellia sp. MB02u-6]MBA6326630.1 diguanylate cyclase [Colwellia sp. MB02u-6]
MMVISRQLKINDDLVVNKGIRVESEEKEYHRARCYSLPLTLFTIGIDHFKSINDKFAHPAGDQVLIEVTKKLKASLR